MSTTVNINKFIHFCNTDVRLYKWVLLFIYFLHFYYTLFNILILLTTIDLDFVWVSPKQINLNAFLFLFLSLIF